MKLRKVVVLFLVASMVLSFTACARQAEPDTQNENSTQEEQPEQKQETQQSDESQTKQNPPATEQNSDSNSSKQQKENKNPSEEEPTEEELLELFERAMNEILNLATNPTDDVLYDIFDGDIECVYSNQVTIDGISYQWTSRRYSELVDYYSQIFTGESLDWILDSSFADVDGVLYGFAGGGATGWGTKAVSIEKLEENTYKGTYLAYHSVPEGEEESTTFEIEKTDAGYRISSIDYHPYRLDTENLKVD